MQINVELRGLDKATDAIRAAVVEGMRSGLEAAALRGQQFVSERIEKPYEQHGARVAHGLLLGSVTSQVEDLNATLGRATIFAQAPSDVYSGVIEFGRRPGRFPPHDAIRLWLQAPKMRAVVETFAAEIQARRRRGKPLAKVQARERAERALAFLIGRKIAKKGFPGHFMFERSGEALKPELQEIFTAQIAAAVKAGGLAK